MKYELEKALIERTCYVRAGWYAMVGIILSCASLINYMSTFAPLILTITIAIVGVVFLFLAVFPFSFGKCREVKNK